MPASTTLVERDLTALLPCPLYGNSWEGHLLREFLADWLHNAIDSATFREVTELETVARRAVQAGHFLRQAAGSRRPLDAVWLTSVAAAHQYRAQRAADEIEYVVDLAEIGPVSTNIGAWAVAASANAWTAAHLTDAAAIVRDPDGDEADARALLRAAADRLDSLRPIAR
ncbi:hypothetical protein RVR_P16 (plasmid) [Actinacidiphila reveromycinica]|uniref:Uncharacterized protein n=1 Tax=Actinacidiphila reveromycinica TaxID=659352 RepID=A0A7U3LG85_9ACTN|nr:hypothetical protein [Streptomyces sp. SN-593]BBG20638.1 hypothetical protein RVR_P16 [Streptomyces sp. SN-593]